MKLDCEVEKIKNGIMQVEKITGKNLTLPILSSILLIASGKSLKLRATNLSLGIEIEIPAKIEKEGIVAISGTILAGIFSNIFQNENVSLESENGNLMIKSKKSRIKLKGQIPDDFPTIPIVDGTTFEIESKKLIEGIKSVYYSSSLSDIKPEISSVFIYTNDDNLVFVSTDSFRLAEKKIKVKGIEEIKGILIPFKNISEILRIFGDVQDTIKICFNKNQISFSSNYIYLTSRIIDGVFPDYRQIVPKEFGVEAIVLKQDLLSALKLSNIFSDKFNQIDLLIKTKEKVFELSSQNNDVGENKTYLDAAVKGGDTTLGFNYKYFLDCFQSINTDSVSIKLNQSSKPMVISGNSDNSFTYLIMPMNR
ncbi:MAG: polymerase III subunit beta protein [Candidatus Nomurabacteria bacterium GW2011_GWE1_32_28]|uniref:Beta sliding clamp n=1 Tax=Candidatus Nomurabacteria bacterium GW2011_GWF1_31_48 TaxID=1618767 RepID=A0A0F9YV75_9BACT|nr:MAG: polymerase III subunit beta protein [Candidatus Nomurabacteria bacterium GW2011_GWF2_30_133]KKP28788.1 MAG: polymerase III subunit beta protein [Candidatus Nomurabacteria bacterium GW2011_GWE2_31_40]KKP30366.1 MAG: polymerase III subunit beta protein [Candidatus Nomurabacteria bacterium GW2011_GWF1_31_48]KKP34893.1 MAG: polymerase III subunit beta protein [Candidatus Nomurabacteria bacterium GW2011_GWE1_32_28]HAS80983.1 DNA polymerase III subunit beta [Candidatus Nomurabacteria bacteriu